jgi:hypothetical protein
MPQQSIVLGFFCPVGYEVQSLILIRSLRQFGGDMSQIPVWALVPERNGFSPDFLKEMEALQTQIIPFQIDDKIRRFPFASKTIAAAQGEGLAEQENHLLAWHDRTGFINQTPKAFDLPPDKTIGFRPTDIANIGAPFGQPLPPFWKKVCTIFGMSADQLPLIISIIDRTKLHLYVNAGLLVVRPKSYILRKWAENLKATYDLPEFSKFYQEDQRNAIFMHQAALTAAVVKRTDPKVRTILPENYLFSVDNFLEYPQELKPNTLDEIITGRFHDFFALDHWEELIIASDRLVNWFKAQLEAGPYWPAPAE